MIARAPRALALTLLLAAGAAHAQGDPARYDIGTPTLVDLWVDPAAGDDSGSGATRGAALRTVSAAWARIPVATTLASTGYRIRLVAGAYPESGVPNYWESRWGTAEHPVIVEAADGPGTAHLPAMNIFDCRHLYLVGLHVEAAGGDVLHCERCDHFLLRGATVRGRDPATYAVQEAVKFNQSTHVYVEDSDVSGAWDNAIDNVAVQHGHVRGNRIHDAGDWCIYLKGGSAGIVVEGNEIHDCGTGGFTAGQGTGFEFMTSPWLHYEAYDLKVVNNVVHDTEGAGLGVNGGYDILLAHNTLYRVGSRSHALEFTFGGRGCDGDTATCDAYRLAGGWGTASGEQPIGNRNVYVYGNIVYNPPGFRSQWQHLEVSGPRTATAASNIPNPVESDVHLVLRGNVLWNGPADLPLGLGESTGCRDTNPTCTAARILADNHVNDLEPQLVDPEHGNYRPVPGGNLFSAATFAIPSFPGGDRPSPPTPPEGDLANTVAFDRDGAVRGSPSLAGAFAGVDCRGAACGDGIATAGCEACDDGNTTSGDGCSATCTPECASAPLAGCRRPTVAGKSVIQLANSGDEPRDKLLWVWGSGAATTREEFGGPDRGGGASYRFCLYDEAVGRPRLVLDLGVAAGATGTCGSPTCWRGGRRGFRYAAKPGADPGGLRLLKLDAGGEGRAKILLKGSGAALPDPALPFGQDSTVTAQLVRTGGGCWEALYGAPARLADATRFKDVSD